MHFMYSIALGFAEMSKRCVHLQLHDICTERYGSWFAEHVGNAPPLHS